MNEWVEQFPSEGENSPSEAEKGLNHFFEKGFKGSEELDFNIAHVKTLSQRDINRFDKILGGYEVQGSGGDETMYSIINKMSIAANVPEGQRVLIRKALGEHKIIRPGDKILLLLDENPIEGESPYDIHVIPGNDSKYRGLSQSTRKRVVEPAEKEDLQIPANPWVEQYIRDDGAKVIEIKGAQKRTEIHYPNGDKEIIINGVKTVYKKGQKPYKVHTA